MNQNKSPKAILCSRIASSPEITQISEYRTNPHLTSQTQDLEEDIKNIGGELIEITSNEIIAIFDAPSQAFTLIQKLLVGRSKQEGQQPKYQFGLHIGEVTVKNGYIVGNEGRLAARLRTISPINGVAFTKSGNINIDPKFCKFAIPIGNNQIKGLPEGLDCYGIEEAVFLRQEQVLQTFERLNDRQINTPIENDADLIKKFLQTNSEIIIKQPSRAAAAFGDWIGGKSHLLPGSRDILTRPEWAKILAPDKSNSVGQTISLTQLTEWITSTFAHATASPWLEAIHGTKDIKTFYGQQQPDTGELKKTPQPSANETSSIPQLAPNPTWIWIGAGILTAVLAAYLVKMMSGQPPSVPPGGKGGEQGIQREVDIDQPLSGETEAVDGNRPTELPQAINDIGNRLAELPQAANDINGNSPEDNSQRQKIGQLNSEESRNATTRFTQNPSLWDRIREGLLNGSINTGDLNLSSAQGYLDHWVQEFKIRNNALVIQLRTRQAVTAEICKPLLINYQRAYRQSKTAVPWVILESSKSQDEDIIRGFLPVCQLSPQGRLETLR